MRHQIQRRHQRPPFLPLRDPSHLCTYQWVARFPSRWQRLAM